MRSTSESATVLVAGATGTTRGHVAARGPTRIEEHAPKDHRDAFALTPA